MSKAEELAKIAGEISSCRVCKLNKSGQPVPGEGSPDAKIVFVGEAPGKKEAVTGRPFVGRSGQLLRRLIRGIGLDDEKDVYITSPVKYLPDRGTPIPQDIAHGRFHLMKQLAVIKPKVVVLLGRVAAEGVLQSRIQVSKMHGKIIAEKDGIRHFLTYHPASALRFRKNLVFLEEDFQNLSLLLKRIISA